MSGSKANCHVSSHKWEDTGGSANAECAVADLLIHDPTNDISLQELIENELALRSSAAASAAAVNQKLICDMEEVDHNECNQLPVEATNPSVVARSLPNGDCSRPTTHSNRVSNVTEVDDFDALYNEVKNCSSPEDVEVVAKVAEESVAKKTVVNGLHEVANDHHEVANDHHEVANDHHEVVNGHHELASGHHEVAGHLTDSHPIEITNPDDASHLVVRPPDRSGDTRNEDGPVACTPQVASPELCADSTTDSSTGAAFDSLENSVSEAANPQQPVDPHTNCVLLDRPLSNSEPIANPSTATNHFDNDFVPLSEVQIVTEDSAVKSAEPVEPKVQLEPLAVIPEAQLEAALTPEAYPDPQSTESTQTKDQKVGEPCGISTDQDWVYVGDITGAQPTANSPLVEHCAELELSFEEAQSADAVDEVECSVHEELERGGQPVECSKASLSCRIVEEQLSAEMCTPGSPESGQSSKVDPSSYEDIATLLRNAKTEEDLALLCDDEYLGDMARQILEQRLVTSNGAQRLRETELIEGCSFGLLNGCDIVSEANTNSAEKKSVKKKKSTSEESTTTTKTKKTKKTKKYEEKENISVNNIPTSNGFDDSMCNRVEENDDDLMNVCVRELRIMYCNEANKTSGSKIAQYEEPVPASIPIKELKSVSMSDLSYMDNHTFYERKSVRELTIRYEALNNEAALKSKIYLLKDQRSGFGKFDQLTKKTVMHVRSSDPSKAQQQFSQNDSSPDSGSVCKACNKTVFAMEQINAERAVWHKNCFRCKTCNKQLTVDVYSSHEGELFCKPHFRDLFKPKVVVEEEKPSSDKPDLGLEELGSLNVKSRYQVFEKQAVEESTDKSPICVKRSPSILSKLAKFQAKGMDVGVSSDIFNGIDYEESSSSDEEPVHNDNVTRGSVAKEKPVAFNKMNDVKKNWENGQTARREERQEERRQERQNIRSRLFQGKQNKMREAYENAVAESERSNVKKDIEVKSEKAKTIKEKFEKGEVLPDESDEEQDKKTTPKNDDGDVFEAGISKKSRAIFQQIDAAVKTQNNNFCSPPQAQPTQNGHRSHREVITRQVSNDVVRASDPVEEVTVETADISSRFKFFESYKAPELRRKAFRFTPPREGQLKSESPEREVPKDPNVVRCEEPLDNEEEVLKKSNTTAKMLSLFRQLEEAQEVAPGGPKPLKKFTPPPASSGTSSEEESEEESEEPSEASIVLDDVVRACDKTEDEYLKMAQNAAKAKALKEKFEKWEPEKQSNNNAINLLDSEQASLDTTKLLRARFESMKGDPQTDKPRPKVNRFVDKSLPGHCDTCCKKVYPLEKVEAGDKVFHRSCFKCTRCRGILRMETFTMNNGHLYCVPHFKQLFITKGNYDEGFGNDQHKAKWPVHTGVAMTNGLH